MTPNMASVLPSATDPARVAGARPDVFLVYPHN